MRRAITAIVLVALLLLPAAAAARSFFYKGKGTEDDRVKVSFRVTGAHRTNDGQIRFGGGYDGEDFLARDVKFTCTDGDHYRTSASPGFPFHISRDGGIFQQSGSLETSLWLISGGFNDRGNRARGWFRHGSSSSVPYHRTCETERVHFLVNLERQ